ncbi:MAG: hypothetical protein KC503_41825 [Myxococcales bacterium]|nr:hypothetical protein [Myxococcales bacterium]
MKTKAYPLAAIIAALASVLLLLLASPAAAAPARVKVSAYVVNISSFDVAHGSYLVDVYISFEAEPGSKLPELAFEFANGRGKVDVLKVDPGKAIHYRVLAKLSSHVDLREYPFDSHTLQIKVEDKKKVLDELVYVADSRGSGLDNEIVLMGWRIDGWSHKAQVKAYPDGEKYSRYVFNIRLGRIGLTSVLKTFVPLLCFLLISFMTLLIEPVKADSRISINTGMMIASVMFHVAVASSLPPLGYLTLADRLMIATYVVVGFNLLQSVLIQRAKHRDQHERAEKLYKRAQYLGPAVAAVSYLVALIPTFL